MARTFGIIEGSSYAEVVEAADRATKTAEVRAVKYEKVGEHAVAVVLEGETGDIQLALDVAKNANGHTNGNLTTAILAGSKGKLLSTLGLPRWF